MTTAGSASEAETGPAVDSESAIGNGQLTNPFPLADRTRSNELVDDEAYRVSLDEGERRSACRKLLTLLNEEPRT